MEPEFSDLSLRITKQIDKEEKKVFGIFITPGSITSKLFKSIETHRTALNVKVINILEPSCGSCELIYACDKYFNNVKIDGVELNNTIYQAIQSLTFVNDTSLIHADFIQMDFQGNRYDLIVGNPPYCVCEKGYKLDESFQPYIVGRPNTFGLFLLKAISLLNDRGILAFIISKSCLNAAYYAKIRNYIKETCHILEIINFEGNGHFIDTEQSTIGLILQKKGSDMSPKSKRAKPEDLCKYSVLIGENHIFTPDSTTLRSILHGATTLRQMGLKVRTGSVVWNQVKELLTLDETETMLIYNTNITANNTVEAKTFSNAEKKQYIQGLEGKTGEALVVNRGNGNSKYKLQYALIGGGGFTYLVENHLNEIYYEEGVANGSQLLASVVQSFKNPRTQLFIDYYLGNNGLSKTELETIFPIYLL
jgi:hypothetical protein